MSFLKSSNIIMKCDFSIRILLSRCVVLSRTCSGGRTGCCWCRWPWFLFLRSCPCLLPSQYLWCSLFLMSLTVALCSCNLCVSTLGRPAVSPRDLGTKSCYTGQLQAADGNRKDSVLDSSLVLVSWGLQAGPSEQISWSYLCSQACQHSWETISPGGIWLPRAMAQVQLGVQMENLFFLFSYMWIRIQDN